MAEDVIVLQPCRILWKNFVPDRKQCMLALNWATLNGKLNPSRSLAEGMKLRAITVGAFIGLSKSATTGKVVNFLLINPDRSGNIESVLKKDPSFENRVMEVYRVEEVRWAGSVKEAESASTP